MTFVGCFALMAVAQLSPGIVGSQSKLTSVTPGGPTLVDGDRFGQSVAVVGDIDGDGFKDVVVGMPHVDDGGKDRGAVSVLFLGPNGAVVAQQRISATQGGFAGELDDGDLFGWSVCALGDLNGNGVSEIAVGARRDDHGGAERGAVWVLFLGPDGRVQSETKIAGSHSVFSSSVSAGHQFGWSVESPGDINGDGIPDLTVGLPETRPVTLGWPAENVVPIHGNLPSNWEASGLVWNPVQEILVCVSDNGLVATMTLEGEVLSLHNVGGDLEGVTLIDPNSSLVYLGVENPDSIREFDLATGELTGNVWHLTAWMTGSPNLGLEALTYAEGQFYAGHELTGNIYVFNTGASDVVSLDRVIPSPLGQKEITGLHYESTSGTVYAMYRNKRVLELDLNDVLRRSYAMGTSGDGQEGFTIVMDCPTATARVVVGSDHGPVLRWENYPVNCQGPESLPGVGAVWNLILNPNGTPQSAKEIGSTLGAQLAPGDRFGAAVARTGDINGDGIPDLAVGAPGDDDGGNDRGAVWVFSLDDDGGAVGVEKVSSLTPGMSPALADDDHFGWALANLGDIYGDGHVGLGVSIPGYDAGDKSLGAVDVIALGANGAFAGRARIEDEDLGGQLSGFDQFGTGLAGNIDLDGDGVLDLLVGAAFDDEGGQDRGALWKLELSDVPVAAAFEYGCDAAVDGSLALLSGAPSLGTEVVFGVDNPLGTQSAGALPIVLIGLAPDTSYPCGTQVPGWGMGGASAAGELLLGSSAASFLVVGSSWAGPGQPAPVPLPIAVGPVLVGLSVFAQGMLWAPGSDVELGLTSAIELRFGI